MTAEIEKQLQKITDFLASEFAKLQIGIASTGIVDEIEIESYGTKSPLKNLANISCPDARTIKIEPWDKSILSEIERTILAADIGINPQNMGENILCPIPQMTEERRKKIVKIAHEMAENSHISLRNVRQDFLKKIKNDKNEKIISEDEAKKMEKKIEEKISDAKKKIDEMSKKKEAEILKV